jgi:CHAT domain-containing protein
MEFLGFANTRARAVFTFSEKVKISFPEIPFGVREIRAIRGLFSAARTSVIWGDQAREDRIKAVPLADYRVIHLVSHGFYDDRNWQRSALLLQPDENGREDGFLQANDIYGLNLRPELLVLSGCQTGTGYLQKGEGLTGLASAFFYAGARSILMSLWNVNDKATSVFMESFYRHFASGMGKAESLRRAKMEMLNSSYRHPFYWAPFVLQGK